jgi:hypothetical protein
MGEIVYTDGITRGVTIPMNEKRAATNFCTVGLYHPIVLYQTNL